MEYVVEKTMPIWAFIEVDTNYLYMNMIQTEISTRYFQYIAAIKDAFVVTLL